MQKMPPVIFTGTLFGLLGRFYTGRCFAAALPRGAASRRCLAALPRGAASRRCLAAVGSSWFQQESLHWRAAVWRRAANWVPEPIYGTAAAAAHVLELIRQLAKQCPV